MLAPRFRFCLVTAAAITLFCSASTSQAQIVDRMVDFLKSGRVTGERSLGMAKQIAKGGNAEQLGFLFEFASQQTEADVQKEIYAALGEATSSRGVIPVGDLSGINAMIASEDKATAKLGVELAGLWKVETAAPALAELSSNPKTSAAVRSVAIDALISLGGDTAKSAMQELIASDNLALKYEGLGGLARLDASAAAKLAPEIFAADTATSDPAAAVDGFLASEKGTSALTASLKGSSLAADPAKKILRHMNSIGRSDEDLRAVLYDLAGINGETKKMTPEEMVAFSAKVEKEGDPHRGQLVFRRKDLSCTKCHKAGAAGGAVGPDLSGIGANNPHQYLITSLIEPSAQVKEAWKTVKILDFDGNSYVGVVVEENDERIIIKDANGKQTTIAEDDIDLMKDAESLMPKGLVNFMTEQEFVDLTAFLSALGKPDGPFPIKSDQTIQRWRVLRDPAAVGTDDAAFEDAIDALEETDWDGVYSFVEGTLPLTELQPFTGEGGEDGTVVLKADLKVVQGGEVGLRFKNAAGIKAWYAGEQVDLASDVAKTLEAGEHSLLLKVDLGARKGQPLAGEFFRPEGSKAEFEVVGGL